MTTDELRRRFLNFFSSKGHKIDASDTLIPKDDPTLLFTSAGMNQFKQEFLGKPTQWKRRATCQRCLRTGDLDQVGKTKYHHTFFEMLGNFSFGDYFKQEAISWAWEFVTRDLNLPAQRLWVSVYQDDQEAYQIWRDKVGVPAEKIIKLGPKENFWPANAPEDGPDGPCGPCSEIFYDQGEDAGCGRAQCDPSCDCGRFVETWNLVFTQFDRQGKNNLKPLPSKNIDTGMGLERMAAVMQNKPNNFEIDIFKPIVDRIETFAGRSPQRRTCYTIADHIRAITFAIADDILPSNDERGYVIRKLIRRAVWHGRALGIKKPFLNKVVPTVTRQMKSAYPYLEQKREDIAQVVQAEEKRFQNTLQRAMGLAEEMITQLKQQGKKMLPGEQAFKLYDTYGLPQEMLQSIVQEHGFKLDNQGFARQLELQRKSSQSGCGFAQTVFAASLASKFKLKPSKFVGDKKYTLQTKVSALFKDEQKVKQAQAGQQIKIVLESTPFYGESGGQIGDTGIIKNKQVKIEILDTKKSDQVIVHLGKVTQGTIKVGDKVEAQIDRQRRQAIMRNHTATHLLQGALRQALGSHVRQAGSWVGPDRLRFDFTHFQALTDRQLQRVQELVNQAIKQNKKLAAQQMNFEQAQKIGALAFFGEKYEEKVRVIKVGDISLELCGGTHVAATGDIALFKITGQSAVGSGIRRIEAVTSAVAQEAVAEEKGELQQLVQTLGVPKEKLPERIDQFLNQLKNLNKGLEAARLKSFKSKINQMIAQAGSISGVKIIIQKVASADMRLLRLMSDLLRQKAKSCVVVLASLWEEKALIVCALAGKTNLDAGKIIRSIAREVEGSGGGRADFAQAGGRKLQGIDQALIKAEQLIKKELNR